MVDLRHGLLPLLLLGLSAASAPPVRVLGSAAVEPAIRAAAAAFTARTGQAVNLSFADDPILERRIAGGEAADLVVAPATVTAQLAAEGQVVGAEQAPIGRAGGAAYVVAPLKAAPVTAGAKAFTAYVTHDGKDRLREAGLSPP